MKTQLELARELRTQLEQYFTLDWKDEMHGYEVKWLCEPEDIDKMILVVFAKVSSQPWLGNATTRELLDELRARCKSNVTIDYKTNDEK